VRADATLAPRAEPLPPGFGIRLAVQVVAPALIGAATGACVTLATWLTEDRAMTAVAALPGMWPALFSPLALLATLGVVTWVTRTTTPSTAELYIVTYYSPDAHLPLRQLPGRVLGAMTTVAFGGSQGLESPSALIGASFGDLLGRARRALLPDDVRRSLLVCGASAGIAAVFSSAATGMLYGMEIPFRRDVDARRLVPCAIAAACAFLTRAWLIGARPLVVPGEPPRVDGVFVLGVLLVGIGCGLGARLFASAGAALKQLARHGTPLGRAASAGAVLAGLAAAGHALTGRWITFGPGYIAADWITDGGGPLWVLCVALLVRVCGTLTCVYGGGGGGVFTSLACAGVFVGQIVAVAIGGVESHVLPFLGAACFLGAGYRIPLACMMLVFEGTASIPVGIAGVVAVAIGQVLMGRDSVSDAKHEERLD
jgi:CIC family chloride channel protein